MIRTRLLIISDSAKNTFYKYKIVKHCLYVRCCISYATVVLTIANQVRFLDTGSNVITDKEQKRVWFSRLWLSIRRKQSKRKPSPADPGGLAPPVTPAALADIQCEFNDF